MSSLNEIVCPKCKTAFKIDEAGYADILSQVHSAEFEAELEKQLKAIEKANQAEIKLAEANAVKKADAEAQKLALEIEKLKSELKNSETTKELALTKATSELQKKKTNSLLN